MNITPIYKPASNETQLTLRAVIAGCLLGSMISVINVYFGLQTGWATGAALISAILGYAFMKPFAPDYSILENNITETAGSAAGSMTPAAGLISVIPALSMLGLDLPVSTLYVWSFSVALIGIFFVVPLRRQMLFIDKLRFPSGIAAAETIVVLHNSRGKDRSASALLQWAILAASITLISYFFTPLSNIKIFSLIGLSLLSQWGFTLLVSPMMIGGGMLMGFTVGSSLLAGALLCWGIIGPLIYHFGWVSGAIFDYRHGVQGWLLWPGVTLMTVDSLAGMLFTLPAIIQSRIGKSLVTLPEQDRIPTWWWVSGFLCTATATIISLKVFFQIGFLHSLIGILLSVILAFIATRAAGETDINPLSSVGKITQVVYAGLAPGQMFTNLLSAGLTTAGAVSSADLMQDLKTGYLLGASPRKQFIAQICGAISGVIVSIPVYLLFKAAYTIGSEQLPAPAAHAWKAFSEILTIGTSALPTHADLAVIAAAIFAALTALLRSTGFCARYLPSNTAMGIAFIIPAYYSLAFFIGAIIYYLWRKHNATQASKYVFAVASGLMVGEGLMGIVKALLTLLGVKAII